MATALHNMLAATPVIIKNVGDRVAERVPKVRTRAMTEMPPRNEVAGRIQRLVMPRAMVIMAPSEEPLAIPRV